MAFGRSNNSVEVPVTLGLQEALRQIAELRKQLNEGVKSGSGSFDFITKVLDKAQKQADQLGGKLGEAFKTSNSAKSFMREYQSMIEMLSTAKSKMGNLGFEEIKFSVKDLEVIDNAVKLILTLSATLENIRSGKAIELINSSSVEGVENLRTQIGNLIKDTSGLTFDGLNKTLQEASNEAGAKVTEITDKINNLKSTIDTISADGLSNVQAAVNSTSQNNSIGKSLVNAQDINEANERLRQFANTLSDIPARLKSFTVGRDENVAKFVLELTDKLEKEYLRLINVVKDNRDKINSALTAILTNGHVGKNNLTNYTKAEYDSLINSEAILTAITTLNLDLNKVFDGLSETNIRGRMSALKAALKEGFDSFNTEGLRLEGLKSLVESLFNSIFEGLGETIVLKQKDVLNKLKEALNGLHIDPSALKEFGFDINNIKNGQDLASVYNQLKSSLDAYVQSLEALKQSLSSGELENAKRAQEELNNAITTAAKVQEESGSSAEGLLKLIDSLRKTIEDLVNKYNLLTGQKITFNTDEINKGKSAIDGAITALDNLKKKLQALSNVQSAVTRWMGFYQVLNLTKRAIKEMISHITELDTVMTQIAVVTNMSQDDLWGQIGQYSEIARQYGVAIKGVYEVSLIYYQQGLNKGDVMNLTTETLKMARIAGIDYATAADYMTTAIRGFKLEMTEAAHVTDVFSNLAAHTASDTEELATAISKTASSAEAVGASFEATSAMIATMVSVTRESATNIGTALKSVISRYGEMTSDPTKLVDSEGEEMSLNRVDKALRTIGITILDTNGQFRDFDDVILELGDKWDSLDKNAQRYIATIMAGNRQQSRFLALVGNVDEYRRALELANNSEDTGELLTLKTLDSIDAKMERMKVTIQEFYTSSGILDLYKGILDTITNVISAANDLPKAFGNIPLTAIAIGALLIATVKNAITLIIEFIKTKMVGIQNAVDKQLNNIAQNSYTLGHTAGVNWMKGFEDGKNSVPLNASLNAVVPTSAGGKVGQALLSLGGRLLSAVASTALSTVGSGLSLAAMNLYGSSMSPEEDRSAAGKMWGSVAFNGIGGAISGATTGAAIGSAIPVVGTVAGAIVGAIVGGVSLAAPSIASAISMGSVELARKTELDTKAYTKASQEATVAKGETKELEDAYNKLLSLEAAAYSSAEAMSEYHEYMNLLGDSYPTLISSMDSAGNSIITLLLLEEALAESRANTADKTLAATKAELKVVEDELAAYLTLSNTISVNGEWLELLLRSKFGYINSNLPRYASIIDAYNKSHGTSILYSLNDEKYNLSVILSSEYLDDFKQWQDELLNTYSEFSTSALISNTKAALEAFKKALPNINLGSLTGYDNLEDLDNLSREEILTVILRIKERAGKFVENVGTTLNNIDNLIERLTIEVGIQDYMNLTKNNLFNSKDLGKFTSLFSFIIDNMQEETVDWNTDINKQILQDRTEALLTWAKDYYDDAEWVLNSLNYNNYATAEDLEVALSEHNLDENEQKGFIKEYKENYILIEDKFKTSLEKAFNLKNWMDSLTSLNFGNLANESSHNGNRLNTTLLLQVLSGLTLYTDLMDSGYTIAAENYLNNLYQLYSMIVDKEYDLTTLSPILQNLDLSDVTSIDTTIATLSDMEGMDELVAQLLLARNNLVTNVSLSTMNLADQIKEVVKEIDKVTDKIGKGMKYSDALEVAQDIFDKIGSTDLSLDDIITYDKDLGQYVITTLGIREWIAATEGDYAELIKLLNKLKEREKQLFTRLLTGVNLLTALSTDEQASEFTALNIGKFLQYDLGLTADETKAYQDRALRLIKKYLEEYSKNNTLTWEQFLANELAVIDAENAWNQLIIDNAMRNSYLSVIAGWDYKSIAAGTSTQTNKESLLVLLELVGVGATLFEEIYADLLHGRIDSLNAALASRGVLISTATGNEVAKANAELYVTALNELMDNGTDILSENVLALLAEHDLHYTKKSDMSPLLLNYFIHLYLEEILNIVQSGALTIEEYNDVLLKAALELQEPERKAKAVLDMAKDGISINELTDFIKEFDPAANLNLYWDSVNKVFTNDELNKVFKYDEATLTLIPLLNAKVPDIFAALEAGFGISLKGFTDAATETIDLLIALRAKNNQGKQIASLLKNLSSANVGDEVNVSALTSEMLEAIGATDGTLTIKSEYLRDNVLLLLKTYIEGYKDEGKEALKTVYNQIESSILSSKTSRAEAYSGIMKDTLTVSDILKFAKDTAGRDVSSDDAERFLKDRGYVLNTYSNEWEATIDTIKKREADIKAAEDLNATPEQIAEINTFYDNLEDSLDKTLGANSALNTILQNYTSASNEDLNILKAKFERAGYNNIPWEQFITDNGETSSVDVSALIAYLKNIGFEFNDAVKESIAGITDNYLSAISSAASYISSGFTSLADILKFINNYNNIEGLTDISAKDFHYDELLGAFTIDASFINNYIEALVQSLKGLGINEKDARAYVKDLTTKSFAEAIDVDAFLSSLDLTTSDMAQARIELLLKNYYSSKGISFTDAIIANDIETLLKGGKEAVELVLKYAKDAGRELSAEEMQKYYAPLAEKYSSMASKLAELTVGLYIAEGEMRDILEDAGVVDETTGLVTSVKNMAKAYKDIYINMKGAAGRTQKQLNSIYASYLTSSKKSEIDAISTLNDAMGMTYEALGELLGDYGKSLETFANNLSLYGLEDIGGGQVRINDFRAFASGVGLTDSNSEAYISAFKAYNDSLIALDNSTRNAITEEVQAIASANPGERVNLTTYWTSLDKAALASINTSLLNYGGLITDGILRISEQADIKGIIDAILSLNNLKDNLLPDLIAALYDTLDATLTGMIDSVRSAAEGTISGEDFAKLHNWAQQSYNIDIGLGVKTSEGYLMNEDALFALYNSVSKVDSMLAKSMIPDLSKVSSLYKTLPDLLKAYASATNEAKKSLLKAAISSLLRNPDNYNIMGGELPTTWLIAENFYGDAKKALTVTNLMINKGLVGVSDFSSLMQLIMSGDNAADRLQALEWMLSAPEFFVETSDGLMINTAKMGIKNLKELNRMWIEAAEILRLNGAKELEVYNLLYYGSESLLNADITDEEGNISAQKIKEIADAKTKLGENVKNLLDNIKINNKSLYDYLNDKNLDSQFTEDMRDKLLTTLANTNWDFENFDDETLKMFKDAGLKGTVKIDGESGQITFEYNQDATTVEKVYTYGGTEFKDVNEYLEFLALTDKDGFTEKTTGTGENKKVTGGTYKVNDEIDVTIEIESGSVIYSFTTDDGKKFTATNEASIMQAIADWAPKPEGGEIEGSQETISYTVSAGDAQVKVIYDLKGKRQLLFDPDESADLADEVRANTAKTIEIPTPVTAVATIEELQAKLDSNALVNITKGADGNVTVTWAEANGNIKSITLTPDELKVSGLQEKINELLQNTGATLVITPDTSAVEGWVKTFNPTKVVKIKPEIVGDTNLHLNISYSKSEAKGNVALAAGTQSTLMGELGPELWVSGGHYYIAGRNGAEFVDLPKDAIVFNHLQTARLLGTGASGRGTPITSDRAAVALAHGNWNGGPARGNVNDSTVGKGVEEMIFGGKSGNSGGNKNNDILITLSDEAKSKLSSLISDALSKGFENLDWSDYEKELGSMMDEIKNTARINYRAFIDTYASQCDKTTSEINELYFLAWQKDLEDSMDSEDIVSAAEGLNFYANGNIGGSASDWQSIIGDRALITDLVKKGIMSYDAATKQYFVTNAEALANAGVDISQIEGILEMIYDSLRSQYDLIVDYISNGLEGSLTAMDSKSLQSLVERMGITDLLLDFELTVNGLKLSLESAISLYNELKKVDSIAALLTFNELVENLLDSNDNYKTMTSLLTHIYDLTDKISLTDKYSDTKIKQYQEELSLAKQIAAVRATTDEESFSWYDEELPAGMNNPLNYISSWQDSIEMLRNASESGVADFKGMVNTAKQINALAKALNTTLSFCGYELDGSTEALDAIITAMAGSLGAVTTDSGTNFGVVLEKMGADITDGASSYENSATSAMLTMALAQIQILDGLIATFEMLAALEGLEKIDLNLDKKIDLEELFDLTADVGDLGVKLLDNAATAISSILEANDEIAEQLKTVTYGSYTLYDLFKDASDGYLNAEIAKEDFLKLVLALYELALGDYDKNNIAGSLYDKLATLDLTLTLTLGDYTINVKYSDYKVTLTDDGKWKTTTKGTPWDTFDEAVRAEALEKAGVTGTITWSEDKVTASGALSFKSVEMTVVADAEGVHYNYNGVQYNSLNDAAAAAWNAAGGEQGTQLTLDEWKIQQGITVVTTVSKVDTSNISKSLIDKLVGTSWQEIKSKWDAATTEEAQLLFQIEYGFTLDDETTEADFNKMKERLGITENRMELTLAITNLDEIAAEFASKMTNITLNPTSVDATGSATVTADTTEAVTSIGAVEEAINKVIKAIEYLNTLKVVIDKGTAETDMLAIEKATKDAQTAVGNLDGAVSGLTTLFGYLNNTLNTLQGYLSSLSNSTISINAVGQEVLGTIALDLHSISTDIASLKEKEVEGKIVLNITTGGPGEATGNVIGNGAFAAGSRQVLMGELGPELYVTGGRYYVAGQGGAEFVNLPNDAIVFNHLLTRKLLSTGAAGRGKPVTNEKAATSLATGNAMGLAMANVQQTLATLKLLRAMWQSIANASITDMVGLANMKDTESSSDSGSSKIDRKAWIETLEKWYNWLQKIAELEKEINYEEQLRNTLETRLGPKGKELYESQKRELEMIKQQYAVLKSLVDSRREYFETRRAQLNSSVFGKFYQFDEHGLLFYTRGTKFEFGKTAEYAAAQKAAQANGGSGTTTTTMTNVAPEMTKHTAEWNKSIENLALAIYNNRALTQWSRLSDGSISSKINHYETMDLALKWALTLYRIDENGKATYLGNPTAKGDPLAYSDVSGRLWDIWVKNIGVDFDRLQSGEKLRSNIDLNALNASSEYKKLLSQTIQDTAKAVGQEVGGGSTGGGVAGANPPRSELAQITQIEGGFAALMELWARDPQTLEPKYTPAEQYAIAQSLGFGNYMLYDQSGNKIEPGENGLDDTFYTSALQALTDNLDADREEMQSLYDSIEEDEKKLLELEQKLNEILLAIRDNQIDVENKILDAIEAREQAIIDELTDTKEVLEDNADKYINGLNEALSNELRMYQSNKSLTELESLRRQLAILQRSGGSASQINSLLQQIDAKEQENYFDTLQLQIDAILAASDLEIERLDKLIEIMETTLEYSKEHGLLWAEVSLIMQLDDGVIMDFLLSNTAEYLASSALQQSATYDELLSMVNLWTAYRDDLNKYRPLLEDMEVGLEDIMANIFSTDANVEDSNVISAIVGANVQVAQGMLAVAAATGATALSGAGSNSTAGTGTTSSSGSVKGSGSTATSAYANWLNGMGDALGTTANWMTAIQSYYKGDSSKSMAALTGALALEHYDKAASQPGSTAAKTWVASHDYVYDKSTTLLERYANWNLKNIKEDLADINDPNGKYKDMPEDWKRNKINVYTDVLRLNGVKGYSSGGSVDYTGLAMVHGTPTRPEYFLDAEETKMWKSDILGSNSSSLTSRLLAFREILNGIESVSSHINNSTDNGVIIEKAEVNVDVALLANDYDARRAGDTIMDEILQIARKTGVSSVRR